MLIRILCVLCLCLCCVQLSYAEDQGEEIALTTYYPAPYGDYNTISLAPDVEPINGYTGLLYYDNGEDLGKEEGLYFFGDDGQWRRVGIGTSGWNLNGSEITTDKKVGIGVDATSNAFNRNNALVVNGTTQIGVISNDVNDATKEGSRLFFSGGGAGGTHDPGTGELSSENSDVLYMQRYNAGWDKTELRVSIGDNAGSGSDPVNTDKFVVGASNFLDNTWYPAMTVDSVGNVNISGNLTVAGPTKTFVINHPDDAGKYLVHATIEGPENAVYYRGSAQLENGAAIVELPEYFESLTRKEGRTLQLTNIDGFDRLAVQEQGGEKIKNRRFIIISENPLSFQKFDWQVMAVRNDVLPLEPEPDKENVEIKGDGPYTYLIDKK